MASCWHDVRLPLDVRVFRRHWQQHSHIAASRAQADVACPHVRTMARSMSSVSGTPSMTESPRQMTPARCTCDSGAQPFHVACKGVEAPTDTLLRMPCHSPSQSKMKQSTASIRDFLSSSVARRAVGRYTRGVSAGGRGWMLLRPRLTVHALCARQSDSRWPAPLEVAPQRDMYDRERTGAPVTGRRCRLELQRALVRAVDASIVGQPQLCTL